MTDNSTQAPSLFGEVTDRERIAWSLRAARHLVDILAAVLKDKNASLPHMHWEVETSTLTGRALHTDMTEREAAFDVWRRHLDLGPARERVHSSGTRGLSADAEIRTGTGYMRIVLLADILPEDDEDTD